MGVERGASRPHNVWRTAHHPERGSKMNEAVSDSVNTVASLTEFNFRNAYRNRGGHATCSEDDASSHFLKTEYQKFIELAIKFWNF